MPLRVLSACSPEELIRHEGSIERALHALRSIDAAWRALEAEQLDVLSAVSAIDERAFEGLESVESRQFDELVRRLHERLDTFELPPGSLTSRIEGLQSRRVVKWPQRLFRVPRSREGSWGRYRHHSFHLSRVRFVQHENRPWVDVDGIEVPRSVVLGWRIPPAEIQVGRAPRKAPEPVVVPAAPNKVRAAARSSPYLVMYGLIALMLICWLSSWLMMTAG